MSASSNSAMEMFFIIAPCLYLVNITVAALFVRKYKDPIYKKNLYFWIAHLIFSLSQAIVMANQVNHNIAIFIWSTFALMQFIFQSIVIIDIFNLKTKIGYDIILFAAGAITSWILLQFNLNINVSAIPIVFFTAWPIIKHFNLFKNFKKNNFTKNGFLVCSAIMSVHVLDYAYAFDKPALIFPGYLFALILTTGVSAFSFAVLVERALVQIEMKDMLHNTARLSALGGMAGEIAHEFNNPLTVILLNNDQIKSKLENNKQLLDTDRNYFLNKFQTIEKMSRRMSKIVSSLQATYRSAERDTYIESSIVEIIDDANFLCEIKAGKHNIKLNIIGKNKTDDIKIYCRPVQITQILQNLIMNSIDQLEHYSDKWINVSYEKISHSFVEIRIVDSGLGVDTELQGKIFEALFTTKIDSRGTGLGLSISKRLAEEHGGYLELDTNTQHTTFVLGLPIRV